MQWEMIIALMMAAPAILLPVVFVWYMNLGGLYAAVKRARENKTVSEKSAGMAA